MSFISAYQSSASPNDLHNLINRIDSAVAAIDTDLQQYTKIKLKAHQHEQDQLELARQTRLHGAIEMSLSLTSIFGGAVDLGRALTYKIKMLDTEIGNVNETLRYVEHIQSLKSNINQASYAIEHSQWDTAARAISLIQKIPREVIDGRFASVVIPTAEISDPPAVVVERFTNNLSTEFERGFDQAAKARDVARITEYFKLFPLIGQHDRGLTCYAKFISSVVADTCKNLLGNVVNRDTLMAGVFGSITVQFFESVLVMLVQHEPLIKAHYTRGLDENDEKEVKNESQNTKTLTSPIQHVICVLQSEIDSQTGIIIDTFYDSRRIDKLFLDIRVYDFPGLDSSKENAEDDDLISIVGVGDLIAEVATMLQQWSLYKMFLERRYFEKQNELAQSGNSIKSGNSLQNSGNNQERPPTTPEKLPTPISSSRLQKSIDTVLIPTFETLYTFYFRRSVEKAIHIEQVGDIKMLLHPNVPTEEPICTSVVEDTTLILNNTLKHVMSTGVASTVKHFVAHAIRVLQNDLLSFLLTKLTQNLPRYNHVLQLIEDKPVQQQDQHFFGSIGVPDNTANSTAHLLFITYLNSVATIVEYTSKIAATAAANARFGSARDTDIVQLVLNDDLVGPFTTTANRVVSDLLIGLYNQLFKGRVLGVVGEFLPEREEHFHTAYGTQDESVPRLSRTWYLMVEPYRRTMHGQVFSKIERLIVVNLVNILEKRMLLLARRFGVSDSGAVKLERDVSGLISVVCGDNYQLREKFVRVTQIVLLLGMDDEEYAESTRHANQAGENEFLGINWVLTPQERDAIRGYRR